MVLLIFPPVAKPCEPPAGLARLSGALKVHGIQHGLLDLNSEGLSFLMDLAPARADTWTARAHRHKAKHIAALSDPLLYRSLPRYQRAVSDINRVLETASVHSGAVVSLANYQHHELSPLRSSDLLRAAEHHEQDPFFPFFSQRLTEVVDKDGPDLIGVSLNYLSQALTAFSLIGFLRKRYPSARIVLGGGLVTSWMRSQQRDGLFAGLVDHLVDGPGEAALLELCGVTDPGTASPSYAGLPLEDYLSPGLVLPYSASSGCWWNKCSFCPERAERNPFLPLPPARVKGELNALTAGLRPALIHLLDNSLTVAQMQAFIEHPPGAPWYGFARVSRELADPEFAGRLRRAGCVMLKLGLESGDQEVLDAMGKGVHLDTASRALRTLKKAGIGTYVYLIFGTPAEDHAAARRTLAFTAAHSRAIDYLNLALFNMPVCGEDAERYSTRPFYDGDLSLYTDFDHPRGWGRTRVRRFLDREFVRNRAVAPIVRRDLPFFGSNHAPFFVLSRARPSLIART